MTNIAECIDAVYDNGGKSFDRYTVFFGEDVYGMSDNPNHPQGFNQFAGYIWEKWIYVNLGRKLARSEYPAEVIKALEYRYSND